MIEYQYIIYYVNFILKNGIIFDLIIQATYNRFLQYDVNQTYTLISSDLTTLARRFYRSVKS